MEPCIVTCYTMQSVAVLIGQREEHDIFLRKLIQWLGLLRNMSCSSWVCLDLVSKTRHKGGYV